MRIIKKRGSTKGRNGHDVENGKATFKRSHTDHVARAVTGAEDRSGERGATTVIQPRSHHTLRDIPEQQRNSQPGAFPVAGIGASNANQQLATGSRIDYDSQEQPEPIVATLVPEDGRVDGDERERIRQELRGEILEDAAVADVVNPQPSCFSKRRNLMVLGVALLVAVLIGAAVLGVVIGRRNGTTDEVPTTTTDTGPGQTDAGPGHTDTGPDQEEALLVRLEIKSNMPETGQVSSSSNSRAFGVSLFLPGESTAAEGESQFPLVLFSSGAGEKVMDYVSFLTQLAEEGYIVAALEHTFLDEFVYIDGEKRNMNLFASAALLALPHENGPREHLVRARDVKCLLDLLNPQEQALCDRSLTSIGDSAVDFDDVAALIDHQRVAYIGHSQGGTAAQSMISVSSHPEYGAFPMLANPTYDKRIGAVINYDGGYFLDWARTGRITMPFLFLASDVSGFWTDNYNLDYIMDGNSILPDFEGCVPDPTNAEACEEDFGPLGVGNPFWNKRKIVESRVTCRGNGYAIRLKNAKHNSFNMEAHVTTPEYKTSVELTKTFLRKYLKQDMHQGTPIFSEMDPLVGRIYANEELDEEKCDPTESPETDNDRDALSNGDEKLLFLSSPDRIDTDGDLVCDGKEVITFKNPALFDEYSDPDTSCFGN